MLDYTAIEKKWQKAWREARVFEAEPNDKEGMLITYAFAYVNSPMHAGHMKTYSLTDSYARYMRMRGYNVLLPNGFHYSGIPILAMAKRLAAKDPELIDDFKNVYMVPDAEISKMADPLYLANYFAADTEAGMIEAGLGIDWRRKFTTIDPNFSKFIEWQFSKLKQLGFLTQGTHPVGWCTSDNSAVGGHDTKGGIQPKIEEMTVIKFKDPSADIYFPCGTYRPETIYGVTNIFVNDNATYSIAEISGIQYYISKEAVAVLSNQFKINVKGEIEGKELLKKKAINPLTKEEVPVLPGFFIKLDVGTGVVMSVPAHAPFDYVALERLKESGYPLPQLEYKKVIEIKGGTIKHPEVPALGYLKLINAGLSIMDDELERATKEIYKDESHYGVMITGKYSGRPESEARDLIKNDLIGSNDAIEIYILANEEPVYCRDGTRVVVKVVSDQWFINYGDKKWKEQVRSALPNIKILPDKLRPTFEYLVEWLDLRAAERAHGLGTPFPLNPSHIIESLSDSTIYMVFYTFVNILNDNKVNAEQLKPEFFDYVVCAKGDPAKAASLTGIDQTVIQKCKESFEYWYKNTSNHSGSDLINNHFIMYIFNHVAILDGKYHPKQIVPNGLLLYEGQKMSKSIGNTMPVRGLITKYGADPVRFSSIATADLDTETNFEESTISSVKQKNEFLVDTIARLDEMSAAELAHIDYWLYSKLNSKIKNATAAMDQISFRSAYNKVYYDTIAELKWYFERGGNNEIVVRDTIEKVTLMLAPVMPHVAEELWQMLGKSTLVAKEKWPTCDESMISEEAESTEQAIMNTIDDITNIVELTAKMPANKGKRLGSIKIIVADDWKTEAYNALAKQKSISNVISQWKGGDEKEKVSKFLSQFASKLMTLEEAKVIKADSMLAAFNQAKDYISKKFDAKVSAELESASKSQRASRALPMRPSIEVAWE